LVSIMLVTHEELPFPSHPSTSQEEPSMPCIRNEKERKWRKEEIEKRK
jgi:hypothetical protein